MSIQTKVGTIPGVLKDYALPSGSTVASALQAANIDSDGYTITVDGMPSGMDTVLGNNARVILTRNAKGNA